MSRILIVEDMRGSREQMAQLLRMEGHEPICAALGVSFHHFEADANTAFDPGSELEARITALHPNQLQPAKEAHNRQQEPGCSFPFLVPMMDPRPTGAQCVGRRSEPAILESTTRRRRARFRSMAEVHSCPHCGSLDTEELTTLVDLPRSLAHFLDYRLAGH